MSRTSRKSRKSRKSRESRKTNILLNSQLSKEL